MLLRDSRLSRREVGKVSLPFPGLLRFAVLAFRSFHLWGAGERYSPNTIAYSEIEEGGRDGKKKRG